MVNDALRASFIEARPKTASSRTALGNHIENKTIALIIASDLNMLPGYIRERFSDQISRARAILEKKGLGEEDIRVVQSLAALDSLYGTEGIFPLAEDQTLLIYLTGHMEIQNATPCFYLNPNDRLTPEGFYNYIPQDPNQHLFILIDAPYAEQFLAQAIPLWPEHWAGVAGTNRDGLFFPVDDRPFPCYASLFFSKVLSGATVAQAYCMAENAVSLTRQQPRLFPDIFRDYYTVSQYLNYYLGTSGVLGAGHTLFTHCSDLSEEVQGGTRYILSLTPNPDVDIHHAWAVLTSPASSLYQTSEIVDLSLNGSYYTADVELGNRHYKALFMAEGKMLVDTDMDDWQEWQEVSIAATTSGITHNPF